MKNSHCQLMYDENSVISGSLRLKLISITFYLMLIRIHVLLADFFSKCEKLVKRVQEQQLTASGTDGKKLQDKVKTLKENIAD